MREHGDDARSRSEAGARPGRVGGRARPAGARRDHGRAAAQDRPAADRRAVGRRRQLDGPIPAGLLPRALEIQRGRRWWRPRCARRCPRTASTVVRRPREQQAGQRADRPGVRRPHRLSLPDRTADSAARPKSRRMAAVGRTARRRCLGATRRSHPGWPTRDLGPDLTRHVPLSGKVLSRDTPTPKRPLSKDRSPPADGSAPRPARLGGKPCPSLTDPISSVLHSALDGLALRQRVIADNIANVDTPGFRATTVDFESSLQAAIADGVHRRRPRDRRRASRPTPRSASTATTSTSARRRLSAMQSQFQYQMVTRAVSDRFDLIKTVVAGQLMGAFDMLRIASSSLGMHQTWLDSLGQQHRQRQRHHLDRPERLPGADGRRRGPPGRRRRGGRHRARQRRGHPHLRPRQPAGRRERHSPRAPTSTCPAR